MVEARNALVVQLRKAGDKAGAAQVKALKRPAPGAWALNQVHFEEPELLDRALEQTERVRHMHAQDQVDPRELWALAGAQKAAVHAVVEAALKHCASAGIAHGPAQQRRILSTVQGWLSGAGQEPPGRMTLELEAGGFDAVQEVGSAFSGSPVERPGRGEGGAQGGAGTVPTGPAVDVRAMERAQSELREAEANWESAREQARAMEGEHEQAKVALASTRAELEQAERTVTSLRFQLKQANDALVRSKEAVDRAQITARAAEAHCARRREALERLERQGS